jgi:hypothetical protein
MDNFPKRPREDNNFSVIHHGDIRQEIENSINNEKSDPFANLRNNIRGADTKSEMLVVKPLNSALMMKLHSPEFKYKRGKAKFD